MIAMPQERLKTNPLFAYLKQRGHDVPMCWYGYALLTSGRISLGQSNRPKEMAKHIIEQLGTPCLALVKLIWDLARYVCACSTYAERFAPPGETEWWKRYREMALRLAGQE